MRKEHYESRPEELEIVRSANKASAVVIAREEIAETEDGFTATEYAVTVPAVIADKYDKKAVIALEAAREAKAIRKRRNELLAETDYLMLTDVSMTEEKRAAWAAYRQALRDITSQDGFPFYVTFPAKP